ncbi:MAG: PD-(D/E)XK nuclease family protein [Candidatus Nanopelagicales bacterium]
MTQASLDGMPRRLFVASPSKLTTWLDCPRRYALTYLERRPSAGTWAHNSVGASIHNALRDWWSLDRPRRTPQAAAALVRRGWIDQGFRDAEQSARWRELAAESTDRYAATLDPDDEPAGTERTVGVTTAVLALNGRVDRIDRRGDALVVVDYKTGRRVPTEDDVRGSLALAAYAAAVRRTLKRPCTRVELHHVPSGVRVGWEHTDASLARHLGRMDDIAEEAAAAERAWREDPDRDITAFEARTGVLCGWCDLRDHCPQGRAAAPAKAPWAALVEPGTAGDDAPPDPEDVLP